MRLFHSGLWFHLRTGNFTVIKQRINVHYSCHVKVIRNRQEAGVQRAGFLVWPCLHLPWDTREVLSPQKGLRALNQKAKELNKTNPNYTGFPSNGILLNLAWKLTALKLPAWCSSPVTLITGRNLGQGVPASALMGRDGKAAASVHSQVLSRKSIHPGPWAGKRLQRHACVLVTRAHRQRGFLEDTIQHMDLTSPKHIWNENATKYFRLFLSFIKCTHRRGANILHCTPGPQVQLPFQISVLLLQNQHLFSKLKICLD